MTELRIQYAVCHRAAAWRLVDGKAHSFKSWDSALFGTDGAHDLFQKRGRVSKQWRYGAPVFAGVWRTDTAAGLLTDGKRLYVVPADALDAIEPTRIRTKAYKEQPSAEKEADARQVAELLRNLITLGEEHDFTSAGHDGMLTDSGFIPCSDHEK